MNPRLLFPWIALLFLVLATARACRAGPRDPALRTWALLALVFGAVSVWLHLGA